MDKRGLAGTLDRTDGGALSGLLSAVYGSVCALDRVRFGAGLARVRALPRPVVSVGNLTVGGGGKTPMVLWLCRALEARGLAVTVLSRGYGRKGKGPARVVLSGNPVRDSASFGDEPLLMAQALTKGRVYVGRDRHAAGSLALSEGEVDVFLLDDGFQHRALARDLDILVVDDRRRFGNGKLLPAGILREPLWRLAKADAVVVTKSPGPDPEFASSLRGIAQVPVFWTGLRASGLLRVPDGRPMPLSALTGKPLVAFAGVADPGSFDDTLRAAGFAVAETVHYADHHPFSTADAADLQDRALGAGAGALITTEKDAARWPGGTSVPCYALQVELFFHGHEEGFLTKVNEVVGQERKGRG